MRKSANSSVLRSTQVHAFSDMQMPNREEPKRSFAVLKPILLQWAVGVPRPPKTRLVVANPAFEIGCLPNINNTGCAISDQVDAAPVWHRGLWARKRIGCQGFDGLSDFSLALSIIFLTQLGPPRAVSFSFCSLSIRTPTTTVSSPSLMGFRP